MSTENTVSEAAQTESIAPEAQAPDVEISPEPEIDFEQIFDEVFPELFEQSLEAVSLDTGNVIQGAVLSIDQDFVKVHVGLKSEGKIPVEEFTDFDGNLEVEVGSIVEIVLQSIENGYGETKLSHKLVKRIKTWEKLENAYEHNEAVPGQIVSSIKGGYLVEFGGIRSFMPGSLIDLRPVFDPSGLMDRELQFKVIKLDPVRRNVVVSRRAVLLDAFKDSENGLLSNIKPDAIVEGTVKSLMDYGAFIDLGQIDGLLHNSDISWSRISRPSEVLEVGQSVKVKVLNIDTDNMRISLGLKQLQEDPWVNAAEKYAPGTRHKGKVSALPQRPIPFGAFVSLEEGIEGLVHVSQMDWVHRHINPSDILSIGDEVEVQVLEIVLESRRLSLGMKQCMENPWTVFSENNKVGDRIKVKVRSITDLGIFASIGDRIDGLIHESDLSWDLTTDEAKKQFEVGQEIEVMVLNIDQNKERVALGIKQLIDDPFSTYIQEHKVKDVVKGKVGEVHDHYVLVDLADKVKGRLSVKEASSDHIASLSDAFNEGDEIEAQIIRLDHRSREIILSIKIIETAKQRKAIKEHQDAMSKSSTVTLGDLLKNNE